MSEGDHRKPGKRLGLSQELKALGIAEHAVDLILRGYTVIEDAAPLTFFDKLRELISGCRERAGVPVLVGKLLQEDRSFEEAVCHPLVVTLAEFMCGQGFLLSQVVGTVRGPGAKGLRIHTDYNFIRDPFPVYPQVLTSVWACDDFTELGGCSRVVPGSHLWRRHPVGEIAEGEQQAVPVECPRGSIVLWDGATWHGSCPRQSSGERVALHVMYTRMVLRTFESYRLPQDVLDRNPPLLASMLGMSDPFGKSSAVGVDQVRAEHARRIYQSLAAVRSRAGSAAAVYPFRQFGHSSEGCAIYCQLAATIAWSSRIRPQATRGVKSQVFTAVERGPMSTRTSAVTVLESLEKGSSTGSQVSQAFDSLIAFAGTAGSAAILTTLPGVGALLAATSAAALAAGQVVKAVSAWRAQQNALPPYEQFRVLYYTTCHRAYLEALEAELEKLAQVKQRNGERSDRAAERHDFKELARHAQEVVKADVTYLIGVDPVKTEQPLFQAYERWLAAVLPGYGVPKPTVYEVYRTVSAAARDRLRVLLAQQNPDASWMRSYLAFSQEEKTTEVLTTLAAVATSLSEWTERSSAAIDKRYQGAWHDYRENLKALPDKSETMFAENFGVRKVFVAPQATYRVIGVSDKSYEIANVPGQLGALLSERVPAGDLRILCGGPGSGKSTVCRMLASQLAHDPAMHPVFLRLRHMREGADLVSFVEASLRNEGLIDRISDLRDVPNLVFILDGFDELVMASRARLRNFFNVLTEELASGPLRFARAIVSGRDTLFPHGDGLPAGAHVLTLAPFDEPRVAEWGRKWRALHGRGPGSGFTPEKLLPAAKTHQATPLQHLASWPLTLHLLARVHTSGTLNLGLEKNQEIEKAFLYRSIMADTVRRQATQASGTGRFDHQQMQRFLRHLAWQMYSRETDSLEFHEVMPLVRELYPDATESDASEITEVAIVNAPELTKGEETGCEFVHKSFSEYLAAEHIAETVERAAFKVAEFGSPEPSWRMSTGDATAELASVFASRLLAPEVQEMLEPMLGRVQVFFGSAPVKEVRDAPARSKTLARIIERLEMMLRLLAQGRHLDAIARLGAEDGLADTAFAAYANYCAGIMIVGTAAARRATPPRAAGASATPVYFHGETAPGTFWRCIGVLEAGGITISESLGMRLFQQMTLEDRSKPGSPRPFDEASFPIRLGEFRHIHGYQPTIVAGIADNETRALQYVLLAMLSEGINLVNNPQDAEGTIFSSRYGDVLFRDVFYRTTRSGLGAFMSLDRTHFDYLLRDIWEAISRLVRGETEGYSMERLERNMREYRDYGVHEISSVYGETRYHLAESFRAIEHSYLQFRDAVERRDSRGGSARPSRPRLP